MSTDLPEILTQQVWDEWEVIIVRWWRPALHGGRSNFGQQSETLELTAHSCRRHFVETTPFTQCQHSVDGERTASGIFSFESLDELRVRLGFIPCMDICGLDPRRSG